MILLRYSALFMFIYAPSIYFILLIQFTFAWRVEPISPVTGQKVNYSLFSITNEPDLICAFGLWQEAGAPGENSLL